QPSKTNARAVANPAGTRMQAWELWNDRTPGNMFDKTLVENAGLDADPTPTLCAELL
ncbi:hypothetical protein PanWU01x14_227310, partial [Parasponia andersonii]